MFCELAGMISSTVLDRIEADTHRESLDQRKSDEHPEQVVGMSTQSTVEVGRASSCFVLGCFAQQKTTNIIFLVLEG